MSRPVTKHVQVDGTWYAPGDVPSPEHAAYLTNPKVWASAADEPVVPGPSQWPASDAGQVQPPAGAPATEPPAQSVPAAGPFDPSAHTLPEVRAYLDGLGDSEAGAAERARVLDAERAGKARQGLVGE